MSIVGIGTDLVEIARLESALARFGDRLARRLLHPDERSALAGRPLTGRLLAKRFAAKEAAVKALGTGFRGGITLTQIAVTHGELGQPILDFHGPAARRFAALGATRADLSLSDERSHALAFVVLSCQGGRVPAPGPSGGP
ncbi:MAG: holo-ACP synthase [Halothiobacillaceae bacterium]